MEFRQKYDQAFESLTKQIKNVLKKVFTLQWVIPAIWIFSAIFR